MTNQITPPNKIDTTLRAMILVAFIVFLCYGHYDMRSKFNKRLTALEARIAALEKTTAGFNEVIHRAEDVLGRIEHDIKSHPGAWSYITNYAKP